MQLMQFRLTTFGISANSLFPFQENGIQGGSLATLIVHKYLHYQSHQPINT